jgi:hypothetical protein
MKISAPFSARAWLLAPLWACGLLVWITLQRVQRVEFVTQTDAEAATVDAASPTGYAGGKRWLIVPEHNLASYQWIAETQQMFAKAEWRVRHIDSENAPFGREVHSPSPYRWWLGWVAWCDHALSGRPLGLAAERAALWADPLLHLLLVAGSTLLVARQFGVWPAAVLAVGLVSIYPFAGGFLPGVPDDRSLTSIFALGSILPLLGAIRDATPSRRSFALAGLAGGLGMWISPAHGALLLVGIALGGVLAAGLGRWAPATRSTPQTAMPWPWRTWALSGAVTCLAAYLIEYFPAHLDFRLHVVHPLHGLAWLGLGELLVLTEEFFHAGKRAWTGSRTMRLILALVAIAALPVATSWSGAPSLLFGDVAASRLSPLPNGVVAKNFAAWLGRDGLSAQVLATCLPLLILGPGVWLTLRRRTEMSGRASLALILGPVLVTVPIACSQLAWWSMVDVVILAGAVAVTIALNLPGISSLARWGWTGFVGVVFLPGLLQLMPRSIHEGQPEFTRGEAEGLIERALAHWLADRAPSPDAVILVPPARTPSWCFHSGLRGLGTANWENRDGLAVAVRIVSATTADEAQALLNQRGVTHIILPSWDNDLDVFAGWSVAKPEDTFIGALHRWSLPPWLRPLPYHLPKVVGFDGQNVAIFEITDEENLATAMSRTAEYFLEMQQLGLAVSAGQVLQRYPADLGALVALAQVDRAQGGSPAFAKTFAALLANLAGGSDRSLAWDRRVSLAIVLAQGERPDLSREQVKRCLDQLDASRLRSLTPASLYRLLVLCRSFGLSISDPKLEQHSRVLLPAELRGRL